MTRNYDVKDEHLNAHNTINLLRLYYRNYKRTKVGNRYFRNSVVTATALC